MSERAPISTAANRHDWLIGHWALASALPMTMFGFELAQIIFYPATRAPNVSPVFQTGLMFCFFALWILVPRAIWLVIGSKKQDHEVSWAGLGVRLLGLGLTIGAFHLLILTVILRFMHSPPGGRLQDLIYSYGEVWLAFGDDWFFAFLTASGLIIWWKFRRPQAGAQRVQIQQGSRMLWIALRDILWVRAAGNSAELITVSGKIETRKSLASMAAELGDDFLKTHRGALVNIHHVTEITSQRHGGGFVVKLSDGSQAPLSRRNMVSVRHAISRQLATLAVRPDEPSL